MLGSGRDRGGPWGGTPLGLTILIPGYPQWSWRQRARGGVLFGTYLAAVGVGLFAWGTPIGLAVLGFAYAAHVGSVVDVIRQRSFPGFGRWAPLLSTSGGLGVGFYFPALMMATLVAWPGMRGGPEGECYVVNCRAYRSDPPRQGDWVWLRASPWGGDRLGRVVAGPGQEVDWADEQLRVDGRRMAPDLSWRSGRVPNRLSFTVPRDHTLVIPTSPEPAPGGPILVSRGEILGRAWAQLYPIRRRRLLP